jgi:hypothetical protein
MTDVNKAYGDAMDALYEVKEAIAFGLSDLEEDDRENDPKALRELLDKVYEIAASGSAVDLRVKPPFGPAS